MDTPKQVVVKAVIRRLETNKTATWRVQIGVTTFWTMVEDVIDAIEQEPSILHGDCIDQTVYDELHDQWLHDLSYGDDLLDTANLEIVLLEDRIKQLEREQ